MKCNRFLLMQRRHERSEDMPQSHLTMGADMAIISFHNGKEYPDARVGLDRRLEGDILVIRIVPD
jgi:hypothetical protein